MIVKFGILEKDSSNEYESKLIAGPDLFEFNTDWFINTKPSINNTDLFLPEWEDPNDMEWVMMYFIAENYNQLLENETKHLCEEAINALMQYKNTQETTEKTTEERGKRLRELIGKLKNNPKI